MAIAIFPDYLDNPEQYAAAEAYWKELFRRAGQGNAADWHQWRPRSYVDGTPFEKDGNPIFDAKNARLLRALQVIQWPVQSDEPEISAWLAELPAAADEDRAPLHELTINLSLTSRTSAIASSLIEAWVAPETTTEQMQKLIAALAESES